MPGAWSALRRRGTDLAADAAIMATPSPEAVAEFESCMQAERSAWKAVAGRLPGAPDDITPQQESVDPCDGEVAGSMAPLSPRPMPLSEAAHGTNLRFRTVLRQAGFQWSQFQTTLMKLGPQALFGHSFIVTVTHAQLGMSRTYQAVHESAWLPDFQQDLEQGVFSPCQDVRP